MAENERARLGRWEKINYFLLLLPLFPVFLLQPLLELAGMEFWERFAVTTLLILTAAYVIYRPAAAERSKRLAADLEHGIFDCAVRYPNSQPGSLRDRWSPGVARYDGTTLQFQAENFQGEPRPVPMGAPRDFGAVHVTGDVDLLGKRPQEFRRDWRILELQTEQFTIHIAAREPALSLLRNNTGGSIR